ncbi:MAG: cytochrome ubiquinol oxidase subunit I [Chthoniobacterales bacterium]
MSGVLSAVFVVLANSWMNAPAGFDVVKGQVVNIDPITAMLNPAAAAPESTLKLLLLALGAGAVVLLPSLFYLFQIFKGQEHR